MPSAALNYDVTFPMFAKIEVNGPGAHPLYQHLKEARPGFLGSEAVKWNFTKFLVGRDGEAIDRFAPAMTPEQIEKRVVALLKPRGAAVPKTGGTGGATRLPYRESRDRAEE